ncbi:uncharacterized protein BO97DRAFT_410899 [Aspergillus homomorphus CBS 101889]|uniref:DUF7598 domain-containing protein n=1 Tax=Aspergillus homomorphus (strain CBS 101889) TaxID=1450537 RepID=A0A395IBL2_ASPHC|nr:hypothetical protein BO97DRAFT_410899 [Aspergillus homomorphus CBS 101889]RAL16523.1 hypothetical protein BO97DRAFT_410899 [Aspergillus homomorphus CBS 101889]
MTSLQESLAGPGYVILNAIRVINIIVFLDIIAASAVMLVKISLLTSFFFFEAVSRVATAGVSVFLIISELPILRGYFDRNWPLLGQESGFITLAVAMLVLGVGILGDLNTKATSQESLGMPFWRLVLSAGILSMIMSVINAVASFVFSDRDIGVSARHVRLYGAVAPQKVVTRAGSQRSFQLSMKREESLPTYSPQSSMRRHMSQRNSTRFPLKISSPLNPMNISDAASSKYSRDSAGVTIPDLSHHPAMQAERIASQQSKWFSARCNNFDPRHFDKMVELGISFATYVSSDPLFSTVSETHRLSGASIKSFLIFFAPIIIPRVINFYRSFRVSIATRPPPRPVPYDASRALNLLFFSITFFFLLSLPFNPRAPPQSIFALTRSRINTASDVLFSRLIRLRSENTLTPTDLLLKTKLTSFPARKIYLRFGPDALLSCQFCSLDNPTTYILYYLPFHVLLPHLFHMAILGAATAAPLTGQDASKWRNKFTLAGAALAFLDLYLVFSYDPVQSGPAAVRAGVTIPTAAYYQLGLLRPLAFAVVDGICALLIYLSATRRFFYTPPSQAEQVDQLVSTSLAALGGATSKLHALSVTRNTVVRDKVLKDRDDAYWRTVVALNVDNPALREGGQVAREDGTHGSAASSSSTPTSIWEEEEVVRAMSRAMAGQGGVDLAKLGMDAAEDTVTLGAGMAPSLKRLDAAKSAPVKVQADTRKRLKLRLDKDKEALNARQPLFLTTLPQ